MSEHSSDNIPPNTPRQTGLNLDTNKLFQGLAGLAAGGVLFWFVTIDRQVNRIAMQLEYLNRQLEVVAKVADEVEAVETRVQRIEDTRYTKSDANACERKVATLDARITKLESRRR